MKKIIAAASAVWLCAGLAPAGEKLTLEAGKALALKNNVDILNSRLETDAARQARRMAFTKYFPSVSALGLALEAKDPLMEIASPGGNLPVYNGNPATLPFATQFAYVPASTTGMLDSLSLVSVTAVQPIYAGGRIAAGNRLAALGAEASEDRERLTRDQVLRSTEEQYWRIVSLAEKAKTLESYEALLVRLRAQVEDAYGAGLAMKTDVLKVRLKMSEVRLNKSKLENGRALAVMAFTRFLGIADDPSLELTDALTAGSPPDAVRADHEASLEKRAEVALLRASVRAETLKGRLTLGEYLPQLGVGISGFYMKMDEAKGKTNGVVFGTLSIPLSGWWEGSHALRRQKAREEAARNTLRDGEGLLRLQMDKAWKDLTDADRELALCREASSEAEENLKVSQDGYDNGLTPLTDLLEAQALRQQARDRVTEAMAAYRMKVVDYLQATGR